MAESKIKRVLVTGVSGFLASHLVQDLHRKGIEIYGISDLLPDPDVMRSISDFRKLDIRDGSRLHQYAAEIRPEILFHLAAVTNVGFSWQHPALTYEINLSGSSNLIESVAAAGFPCTVILMSSAELYRHQAAPLTEESPLSCRSPYALSKWAMEKLVDLFSHHPQLRFMVVRAFNFTGPRQSPQFVASDFARQIARIELGLAKPIIEVGNLSARRDFSDVRDITRYLVELSLIGGNQPETINLCSGKAVAIQDILDILLSLTDQKIEIRIAPKRFRPVDNPILLGSTKRLNERYSLQPRFTLKETLNDLLDYWRLKEKTPAAD